MWVREIGCVLYKRESMRVREIGCVQYKGERLDVYKKEREYAGERECV